MRRALHPLSCSALLSSWTASVIPLLWCTFWSVVLQQQDSLHSPYVPWLSIPGTTSSLHFVYALWLCFLCELSGCPQLSYSGIVFHILAGSSSRIGFQQQAISFCRSILCTSCVASVLILRSFLFLQGRPHLLCPIAPSCLFAAHWLRLRLVLLWRSPVNLDFSLQCASGRLIRWVHLFTTENLNHLDGCCASHMLLFFENWLSTTGFQFCLCQPFYISLCVASVLILAVWLRLF